MTEKIDYKSQLIIANDRIITRDVLSFSENSENGKIHIKFKNGKVYSYNKTNVKVLLNPKKLNISDYKIFHNKKELFDISEIYEFSDFFVKVWTICFANGTSRDYYTDELEIVHSCLSSAKARRVFDYFKETAELIGLKADDGTNLLIRQYEKIDMIREDSALAPYINPAKYHIKKNGNSIPIFPFGCNASQYKAVKNALDNQISIIQGPPGTGKTQTILNIIANLVANNKTVMVVSNNNSATQNVLEKLSNPKYNMGFFVASLGNKENKETFINNQKKTYPNLSSWKDDDCISDENRTILANQSKELLNIFRIQEQIAILKQEYNAINVEYRHFNRYIAETNDKLLNISSRRRISSKKILNLWHQSQHLADSDQKINLMFKLKSWLLYGIADWNFYNQDISAIINVLQSLYYKNKAEEIAQQIDNLQAQLGSKKADDILNDFINLSMRFFKHSLFEKYSMLGVPPLFTANDLWTKDTEFLNAYPVVLSTTFSARSSLNKDTFFDYLIIDEASQVDVSTGALAISCAKNIVVVGDTQQLPNVIPEKEKVKADELFDRYNINSGYKFSENSFLKTICEILPYAPQALLREHYRCHPKIINFCNQKFYNGELIIMTQDNGEKNVLSATRTVEGNHRRGHINQRQIDVICQEILPSISYPDEEIGIIAPYKDQVETIKNQINNTHIDVATVHKFQGREKEAIILTTVDNELTEFVNNPHLLNVAVSRAKNHLSIILNGNDNENSNIIDLVEYIKYNNFEVHESKIYSVFDMLYKQYTQSRLDFLKGKKKISDYDSENIMYNVLMEILNDLSLNNLDVVAHVPLNMIIRDTDLLTADEINYAMNISTHVDFLIYNKISKKIVLIVEVDGFTFHKEGTAQSSRDKIKNNILKKYEIPLIRCSTTGSMEKERIIDFLKSYNRDEI